jgi:hypothetical protein
MWQQWLNLIVGLWIVVSAYLGFGAETMATNFVVSGAIVAVLALWGALQHNRMMHHDRPHERMQRHA